MLNFFLLSIPTPSIWVISMLQYYMLQGIARVLFKMTGLDEKLYLKPINQVHYHAWTKKWIVDPWMYIITPIP
jgi:hypothetical protein